MPTDLEQERELLRAERDAEICGIGYLVDGVCVSPERVRVFYRDRAALAAPAAPIPMHAICEACGRDYGDHDLTRCPTGIESHFRAAAPQAFPERDQSRSAERQGLFRKFDVRRIDGSDAHGGKHHGCRYFVLDMDHDGHAGAALAAYAAACESTHPDLARDLREKWGTAPQEQPSDEDIERVGYECGLRKSIEHWGVRYYFELGSNLFEFARALLSRYGAAPQGREDAEPVCYISAGELQRLREEVPKTGAAIVAGVRRDSYTKPLYDRPQPTTSNAPIDFDALVGRFLSWPLPASVCSDTCVSMSSYAFPRSGTNLLTADEARQMLEHVLAGITTPRPAGRDAREVPSDGEIRTLIDDARADWDESADQWNKWADLGQDERDEVIVRYALANFRTSQGTVKC